ncbi:MAG TPA: DUF3298 domain-containing protein [Phaeodactylibacter sp.]|nr:DUF3298 domain-containing protein [Phaeodactylibacter sp.]
MENPIVQLFDNPEKVLWLRYYSGTIDDINDVSLVLAYDGKICRGKMKYLKSEEEFGITGQMKKQKIRLLEIDRHQQISGYMNGKMEGRELLLDWSSADNSRSCKIILRQTDHEATIPGSDCGSQKWIRTFKGPLHGATVHFILQQETERQVHGLVYFDKQHRSYELKGEINKGSEVELQVIDHHKNPVGKFSGNLTNEGLTEVVYQKPKGTKSKSNFWQQDTYEVGCLCYVDYLSSLGISFPLTENTHFNQWIKKIVLNEKEKYLDFVHKAQRLGTRLSPETRSSIRSYGWYDIDYISDQIISARLWISNSWEEQASGIPISYDLQSNRAITLKSIFKTDFNLQDFIWAYLSKDIHRHKYYEDYDFRKWFSLAAFKSFTIRKEGINFSTPYSSIYGQQSITIPYIELLPHMKDYGIVWEMATQEKTMK